MDEVLGHRGFGSVGVAGGNRGDDPLVRRMHEQVLLGGVASPDATPVGQGEHGSGEHLEHAVTAPARDAPMEPRVRLEEHALITGSVSKF